MRHGVGQVLALVPGIELPEGIPDGRHLEQVSCPVACEKHAQRSCTEYPTSGDHTAVAVWACDDTPACRLDAVEEARLGGCAPCRVTVYRDRRKGWAVGLGPMPFQRIARAGVCNLWVLSCRVVSLAGGCQDQRQLPQRAPPVPPMSGKNPILSPDRPGTGRDLRRSCDSRVPIERPSGSRGRRNGSPGYQLHSLPLRIKDGEPKGLSTAAEKAFCTVDALVSLGSRPTGISPVATEVVPCIPPNAAIRTVALCFQDNAPKPFSAPIAAACCLFAQHLATRMGDKYTAA